jgi:hypothetical protein
LQDFRITKQWLGQAILGLTLICHSPVREVSEFCRDLLPWPVSIGNVHSVRQEAVQRARSYNSQRNLDISWLKDESLEDSQDLPDPDMLPQEIVDHLQTALEQFSPVVWVLKQ